MRCGRKPNSALPMRACLRGPKSRTATCFNLPHSTGHLEAAARRPRVGDTTVDYGISSDGRTGEVILVKTPHEARGQGSARAAMDHFTAEADRHGTTLFLTSDPMEKGIAKRRLDKFYRSLGFVKNAGRNKDFSSRAEFVRRPEG